MVCRCRRGKTICIPLCATERRTPAAAPNSDALPVTVAASCENVHRHCIGHLWNLIPRRIKTILLENTLIMSTESNALERLRDNTLSYSTLHLGQNPLRTGHGPRRKNSPTALVRPLLHTTRNVLELSPSLLLKADRGWASSTRAGLLRATSPQVSEPAIGEQVPE